MRYLLDTHVLLWTTLEPAQLSAEVRETLDAPGADVAASIVSLWEIAIKHRMGRLGIDLAGLTRSVTEGSKLRLLTLPPKHLLELSRLPLVEKHKDPFDHLLVSQALVEGLTLVSRDRWMQAYPIPLLRA